MELKFIGIDVSKETLDICNLEDKKEFFKIKNQKIFVIFLEKLENNEFEYY